MEVLVGDRKCKRLYYVPSKTLIPNVTVLGGGAFKEVTVVK